MKTRIDIDQSAIIYNRELIKAERSSERRRLRKPVVIKGQVEPAFGAELLGKADVFYKPEESPQIWIEVDGEVTPIKTTTDHPSENTTGRIKYVCVHQTARVPRSGKKGKRAELERRERLVDPCPALVKRTRRTSDWAHHIRIEGKSTIVYSLGKPLRGGDGENGVRLWIETESPVAYSVSKCRCVDLADEPHEWPRWCAFKPPNSRRGRERAVQTFSES